MGKPRRKKGEGSILRHANGTYTLVVDIGPNPETGKRQRRWIGGKTVAEAKRKFADLTAMGGGSVRPRADGTLAEWMETWLEACKSTVTANTLELYAGSWRIHAAPHIGRIKLEDFDIQHVDMLYQRMHALGASPNLIDRVGRNLHRAIQVAIRRRTYFKLNPFSLVDRPKVPRAISRPLEKSEAQRFLQAAQGDRFEALWILLITSGLRLGEALGLRWSDIDLETGRVSVQRSLKQVNGSLEIGETKTPKSRRKVVIGAVSIAALKLRLLEAEHEGHGSETVFCSSTGTGMRRENLRRSHFKPICERAGIGHLRMQDLRHTMASLLLLGGISAKVTSERLGHATTRLTLDRYSHIIGDLQDAASDAIESELFARKVGPVEKPL